nr:putative cytosolic iron-sulfur protein assembly protein CIAO1 [Cryptomonas sp.]
MPAFLQIKTFGKHKAIVWNICWSVYGEFLVSCGADGIIFIWGLISNLYFVNYDKKMIIETQYFSNWDNLCKFESFLIFKSYRNISWSGSFNSFCVSSFSGAVHLCKIVFFNNKKSVYLEKRNSLFGPTCEVKSCDFSQNGALICTSTRNKIVWLWEKQLGNIFDCFFILKQHESDIKCSKWYPRNKFLVTSTYEGIIRFFTKDKKCVFYNGSITLLKSTIWLINFSKIGNQFIYCSNRGELGIFDRKAKMKPGIRVLLFMLSYSSISFFSYSNITSTILYAGNEESINILINWNFWIREKELHVFYGGMIGNFRFNIETSAKYPHLGNINCIVWHPKNDNIFASCADDMLINIWYYAQSDLSYVNFVKTKKKQKI